MQRNRFLGDILSTLFDRSAIVRGSDDTRDIQSLCRALLSAEGAVSGLTLAATVLDRYRALNSDQKAAFFTFLNDDLDIDAKALSTLASAYANDQTPDAFTALSQAAEPRRQELLHV